jgi:predicted alpha/beta hydrolase
MENWPTMPELPPDLPELSFEQHRVRTDDGVSLSVQVTGEGPPVLLANGIGVVRPGLDFLAAHLAPHHRVICWDYRGAGASRLEAPERWAVTVQGSSRTGKGLDDDMAAFPAAARSAVIGGEPRKTALFRGEGGWDIPPERLPQIN